jgi:N-acetylmuramoyl-L-alanine amidase
MELRRGRRAVAMTVLVVGAALSACSASGGASSAGPTDATVEDAPTSSSSPAEPGPSSSLPAPVPVPAPVVVLDPGHSGGNAGAPAEVNRQVPAGGFTKPCNTTGTQTNAGYPEHEFTLDVAQRAAELLRAQGVTVLLTRTDDLGVGPCVDARADMANAAGAALAVSIHADGAAPAARGFHVIEPALAPDGGNAAILTSSETAAVALLAAFGVASGEPAATYPGALVQPGLTRRSDLAGLNLARVPAVFIECANMRNAEDARAVTDPAWRQLAAQGIVDGVLQYLRPRS